MISVPISISTLHDDNIDVIIDELLRGQVGRVFICCFPSFLDEEELDKAITAFAEYKNVFEKNGIEVGAWLDSFGHGAGLLGMKGSEKKNRFVRQTGFWGGKTPDTVCPLDKDFRDLFLKYVKKFACVKPSLIMFDDDFRLSVRSYGIGCACRLHMKEYAKRIGCRLPKPYLFSKIFSGKPNRYRTIWLEMSRDTLISFAKDVRKAVDDVCPDIRVGACTCYDTWDWEGTDGIEIAYAFAGKTRPFMRFIGAPYWEYTHGCENICDVVEYTRMQQAWCQSEDIEVFAEGDVYPRPRYIVPARGLELYDTVIRACGDCGILKYMFDYVNEYGYETGYSELHIRNENYRKFFSQCFSGARPIGVRVIEKMHKFENSYIDRDISLPELDNFPEFIKTMIRPFGNPFGKIRYMEQYFFGRAQKVLVPNGIPVIYSGDGICNACFGDNAYFVDERDFAKGMILDERAARILTKRGFDVGFETSEKIKTTQEYYENGKTILGLKGSRYFRGMTCRPNAHETSWFDGKKRYVSSYRYENAEGYRFFVLGFDAYLVFNDSDANWLYNYYRQEQLVFATEWVGRDSLPVVTRRNPHLALYMATKAEDIIVGLANYFDDEAINVTLNAAFDFCDVSFIGCNGTISGKSVVVQSVPSYGFSIIVFKKTIMCICK